MPAKPGGPILYGTTATPFRADGKGLDAVFDVVAFNYDIGWALRHGHLANLRAKSIDIGLDLTAVRTRGGDFVDADLDKAMREIPTVQLIVAQWAAHAEGRKTIAFLPSVALAIETAEEFEAAGVASAVIHGCHGHARAPCHPRRLQGRPHPGSSATAPSPPRASTSRPSSACCCAARRSPPGSTPRWPAAARASSRARPTALLLDLVGSTQQHSLITAKDLLGVHVLLEGQTATEALELQEQTEAVERAETFRQMEMEMRDATERMLDVDPLGRPKGQRYVWEHRPIAGCQARWETYGKDHAVALRPNTHRSGPHHGDKRYPWIAAAFTAGEPPFVIHTGKLQQVIDKAERWLDGNGGIRPASTPDDPASPKQQGFLRALGYDGNVREVDRRDAGKHITRLMREHTAAAVEAAQAITPEDLAGRLAGGTTPRAARPQARPVLHPRRRHGRASQHRRRRRKPAGSSCFQDVAS